MAIFLVAFEAVFQRRSFYQRKKDAPESIPFERDTFYRFLNSCAIHWRKFTLLLGTAVIQKAIAPLTSEARRNVLIIDDSLFSRNRYKKVELLARVYDHVSGTYMKGFRMLTLGWSDGNTFLPLSHCLLSSSSKQQQLQGASKDVDPRSNGGKRWNIEVFFKMCKSYLKLGKETRFISYDALNAHTAIVFARYMMLALEQRCNMDERSLGELFYLTIDELEDLHYLDALASLLSLLMDCAKEAEILDEEQVNRLLNLFVEKLPDLWGKCLKQCA